MKPESLRSEFILTGGATLLSIYLLVASVQRRGRASCFLHGQIMNTCSVHPFTVPNQLKAGGTAAVAIAILIGLAFVVGIIVVQITFFFPTEGLIHVRRMKHLCELRDLDHNLRSRHGPSCDSHLVILTKAFEESGASLERKPFREFLNFYRRRFFLQAASLSAVESLVLNIGRQLAPDAVIREYEYRRSNRQIFVGILPALVIAVVAAIVNPWSSQGWVQDTYEVIAVVIGAVMVCASLASANYQEKVAQAQLLDTAFTTLWSQFTGGIPVKSEVVDEQAQTPRVIASEQLQSGRIREEGQ